MENVPTDIIVLLGLWIFAVIQFGKGKAFPEKLTIYLSLALPFGLGIVTAYAPEHVKTYAEHVAKLFFYGTGMWAITKAAQQK